MTQTMSKRDARALLDAVLSGYVHPAHRDVAIAGQVLGRKIQTIKFPCIANPSVVVSIPVERGSKVSEVFQQVIPPGTMWTERRWG